MVIYPISIGETFTEIYISFLVTPSGVTECTQLEDICETYGGTYDGPNGAGVSTTCGCKSAEELEDCFEDNKLYVEGSLPVPMTLDQCFEACQSVTTCEVRKKVSVDSNLSCI